MDERGLSLLTLNVDIRQFFLEKISNFNLKMLGFEI